MNIDRSLSSFHRSKEPFHRTTIALSVDRTHLSFNHFDERRNSIRSSLRAFVRFSMNFSLFSCFLSTGKVFVQVGVFKSVGLLVRERGSINTSWRASWVNRASRREIARFVGVEDDGVHWRRLMGVVVALANLRLGLRIGFN